MHVSDRFQNGQPLSQRGHMGKLLAFSQMSFLKAKDSRTSNWRFLSESHVDKKIKKLIFWLMFIRIKPMIATLLTLPTGGIENTECALVKVLSPILLSCITVNVPPGIFLLRSILCRLLHVQKFKIFDPTSPFHGWYEFHAGLDILYDIIHI